MRFSLFVFLFVRLGLSSQSRVWLLCGGERGGLKCKKLSENTCNLLMITCLINWMDRGALQRRFTSSSFTVCLQFLSLD